MKTPSWPNFAPKACLDQIETDWSLVHEPAHFVMRYADAVQRYLYALIKDKHDAEEVAQEFFLWVSEHGLPRAHPERGRFRDYLKKVVRNDALTFLRRKKVCKTTADLFDVPAPEDSRSILDQEWVEYWRHSLLSRVWRRLAEHQQRSPGNLAHTVLQLCAAYPRENSSALAARASEQTGKPLRADTFRKQVSRARVIFAQLLVKEVADTLHEPTPADVEEELVDLGLMAYVRDFLPLTYHRRQR